MNKRVDARTKNWRKNRGNTIRHFSHGVEHHQPVEAQKYEEGLDAYNHEPKPTFHPRLGYAKRNTQKDIIFQDQDIVFEYHSKKGIEKSSGASKKNRGNEKPLNVGCSDDDDSESESESFWQVVEEKELNNSKQNKNSHQVSSDGTLNNGAKGGR